MTDTAYVARPCKVKGFEGRYSVFDAAGRLVRSPKALVALPKAEAEVKAKALNADAAKRKLCKGCRHLYPLAEIVGGRCGGCGSATRPAARRKRVNRGRRR